MPTKPSARIDVVKKEDKEAHLISFIRADSVRAHADAAGCTVGQREFTLVVRSLQSPVAKAISSVAAELANEGVSLRLIIAQPILGADGSLGSAPAAELLSLVREARVLRDIRFLDAHEQLRLDTASTWFGDCMRREPGKRDAYEAYAADTDDLAKWAAISFERLWALGEPLLFANAAAPREVAPTAPEVCAAALAQAEPVSPVETGTRH